MDVARMIVSAAVAPTRCSDDTISSSAKANIKSVPMMYSTFTRVSLDVGRMGCMGAVCSNRGQKIQRYVEAAMGLPT